MLNVRRGRRLFASSTATILLALVAAYGCGSHKAPQPQPVAEATTAQVNQMCGACHEVPSPDNFPKDLWPFEVNQGYGFYKQSFLATDGHLPELAFTPPPQKATLAYFVNRAPASLPPILKNTEKIGGCPVNFTKQVYTFPGNPVARVSTVNATHLYSQKYLDIIACQMDLEHTNGGGVYVLRPYLPGAKFVKIADLPNPSVAKVVDMDGDGVPDILVACLGNMLPTDGRVGGVYLLKGKRNADGSLSFTPYPILGDVGRVADVEPIDIDGHRDLIVAEFGNHLVGSIIYLENDTKDWSHPSFMPHVLDNITGTIHVPVCDLTGHGKRDFIALCSQEHEQIFAFLYKARGQYEKKLIFQGKHPAVGSSGIQLLDSQHAGRTDILYTSGDLFDPHSLLRKDQGVYWLENPGTYPFKARQVAQMYGCYRAVAADYAGNGRQDIVAVSSIPGNVEPNAAALKLDSVIYLERQSDGQFKKYSLEQGLCTHLSASAGDIYGDGHIDFVVGDCDNTTKDTSPSAVFIWRNNGPAPAKH